MQSEKIAMYRSFSQPNGDGGNLAAAVHHAGLTEDQMKDIAQKVGFSETAFVEHIADTTKLGSYRILYYTRNKSRVPLCGHASIAAGKNIFSSPKWVQNGSIPFQYLDSVDAWQDTSMKVTPEGRVIYRHDIPKSVLPFQYSDLLSVLEIDEDAVDFTFSPVQQGHVGFLGLQKDAFDTLPQKPDFGTMKNILESQRLIGVHVFTLCNDESGVEARARNFAPVVGIDEESATGSDTALLTHQLQQQELLRFPDTQTYIQGEAMEDPHGVIYTQIHDDEVWVGGNITSLGSRTVHYT